MIIGQNYVNGNWNVYSKADCNWRNVPTSYRIDCGSVNNFASLNPCNEDIIGWFPNSVNEEVNLACKWAKEAFYTWKHLSRIQRADYFWKLCQLIESKIDEITNLISLETGKSLNESRAEVIEALHMVQYCFGKAREPYGEVIASEIPERSSYIIKKPKGVVAVITPWNFPFAIPFWCAGPALMEGNTVVFKPSELTPAVGQKIAELIHEAGFPTGVFNLIHGKGETGKQLVENKNINHIAFTGSAEVGEYIQSICNSKVNKSCSCEMGSKSAVIVFDDADLDLAADACINSAFKLSGQRCVSSSRILVQRNVLEQFKEKFLQRVENISVGDPFIEQEPCSVAMGPLISKEQMQRVQFYNNVVRSSDVSIIHDPDGDEGTLGKNYGWKGYFLRPFVHQCEWSNKPYLKEEIFGPHCAIIPFDTLADSIRIYNDTEFGLAVGIITNDIRIMKIMQEECDAGMIYFNLGSIGAESHLPFTGVKKSGCGGSSAAGMFDSVVHKVAITINHAEQINFPQGMK